MAGRRAAVVVAFAGGAIAVAWFLPFVHIGFAREETITLSELRPAGAWWLVVAAAVLLLTPLILRGGEATRRRLALPFAAAIVAAFLVASAGYSFTDSAVNNLMGGPLLDHELERLYFSQGEIFLRGTPRVGFWLALAGSATALAVSAYALLGVRGSRRRAVVGAVTLIVFLAVVWWVGAVFSAGS